MSDEIGPKRKLHVGQAIGAITKWYPIPAIILLAALAIWAVSGMRAPSGSSTGTNQISVIAPGELPPTIRQMGAAREVLLIDRAVTPRPYLGITYVPMNNRLARQYGMDSDGGIMVTAVAEGSPADRADIRAGDIVYYFDDRPLSPGTSLLDLLWSEQPFATVTLSGWRDGKHYTTRAELGLR